MPGKSTYEELEQRVKELEEQAPKRKLAEEELQAASGRLVALIEAIPDAIYFKDAQGRHLVVNRACEELIGSEKDKILGKTAEELLPPAMAWQCLRSDEEAINRREPFCFNEEMTTDKGEKKFFETIKVPLINESGNITGLVGITRDTTGRMHAQAEIQHGYDVQRVINSLLQLSVKNIPIEDLLGRCLDLILSIQWLAFESRGCIFLVENPPGSEILVMKAQNRLGGNIQKICERVPFGKCLCGLAAQTREVQFAGKIDDRHKIRPEGMTSHGHYCIPIVSADKTLGVINLYVKEGHRYNQREEDFLVSVANTLAGIIIREHAEQEKEKVQGQLRQAQKMEAIGTLAGGIAHDFNNILFPIVGYTDMLLSNMPVTSEARRDLEEVQKAAKRAKDLVKQILTFSRQSEEQLRPLKVQPIIKESLKLLRATLPSTIEIRQDLDPECGSIVADPTQVHQIMMNLCTNAYHAMRDKGGVLGVGLSKVDIDSAGVAGDLDLKPGPYLRLVISDTGHGMDRAVQDRIFEPYFTTKGLGEGTGLGLSVVHGIVTGYGGNITGYSEPGEGTAFHVYLPMIETGDLAEEAISTKPIQGGNESILLVDDEEQIVRMLRRMLEQLGYQVTARTSSVEALEAFRARPEKFDLVITDQTMPNMTGAELARRLMEIRNDIPILLCTGFSEVLSEKQAKHIGIKGFVLKPVLQREMAETIRKVLDEN